MVQISKQSNKTNWFEVRRDLFVYLDVCSNLLGDFCSVVAVYKQAT